MSLPLQFFSCSLWHGREGLIGLKGWLTREPQWSLGLALTTITRQPLLQHFFRANTTPTASLSWLPMSSFHPMALLDLTNGMLSQMLRIFGQKLSWPLLSYQLCLLWQGSLFVILPPPWRQLKIRVFHPHQLKIRYFHYHQLKIRFAVSPTENLVFLFSPTVLPRSQVWHFVPKS